jgi:hypothetical protein
LYSFDFSLNDADAKQFGDNFSSVIEFSRGLMFRFSVWEFIYFPLIFPALALRLAAGLLDDMLLRMQLISRSRFNYYRVPLEW